MKTPKLPCLLPQCTNPARFRGLCQTHYVRASQLIKAKKTTWDELVKHGKAKNCRPAVSNWFLDFKEKGAK